MSNQWYLVHAKTGREALAELHLRRQGYETFLPLTLRTIRHARKTSTVSAAYFPSYLFVGFDIARDQWRPINGTIGVTRLVTAREGPLPAPRDLVDTLRARTNKLGVLDLAGGLEVGDAVRIIAGPFADQLATVERLCGDARIEVLLSIMRSSVPIILPRALCEAVG